jgi:hypothetical protein
LSGKNANIMANSHKILFGILGLRVEVPIFAGIIGLLNPN